VDNLARRPVGIQFTSSCDDRLSSERKINSWYEQTCGLVAWVRLGRIWEEKKNKIESKVDSTYFFLPFFLFERKVNHLPCESLSPRIFFPVKIVNRLNE